MVTSSTRAGVLLICVLGAPAVAQISPAPPPLAQAALPNLAVSENDLADERKYFILHKPGVAIAQAEADLRFCWRYLPRGAQRTAPDFVAWRRPDPARKAQQDQFNTQFGLIGGVIGGIIAGPLERSLRQSRIFRCMVPRGYKRYRTSEAVWKRLNEGDAEQAIGLQARIAAGPVPPTSEVVR